MSKGRRRRDWKAQAERKRTPGSFMPMPVSKNQRRADKDRRWRGGGQ